MQLEKQVCTLQQAKTLKELGVKADTYFTHVYSSLLPKDSGVMPATATTSWKRYRRLEDGGIIKYYPAFSVAELGLACRECISGTAKDNKFYATPDEYAGYDIDSVIQDEPLPDPLPCYLERDTQAEALADLLIWLLKTELLTVDEVNERLNKA